MPNHLAPSPTGSPRATRTTRITRITRLLLVVLVLGSLLALAPAPRFIEKRVTRMHDTAVALEQTDESRSHKTVTDLEDFSLIAVSAALDEAEPIQVRVHGSDGWGDWYELSTEDGDAPDPDSDEALNADGTVDATMRTSEPLWVGHADGYELSIPGATTDATVHLAREHPEQVAVTVDDEPAGATTVPMVGTPPITPRSSWGARPPKEAYDLAPTVSTVIVHHAVTGNDYGPGDVPSILRSIQAFHMDTQGWNDIAYNFAVDKFGTIWEARGGGVTNAVIGGHSRGANYLTTGIVAIGNFSTANPSQAMLNSIGDVAGWKLYVHGVDPKATTNYRITANTGTYPEGKVVTWPTIIGHRDTGPTGCPGDFLQPQLPQIRNRAAAMQASLRARPGLVPAVVLATNADGRAEMFAINNAQQLVHAWQTGPNSWSGWAPIGDKVSGRPTVISNADGRLEVFAIAVGGAMVHAWQVAPNSAWTPLYSLGGRFSPDIGVGAGVNASGLVEVFAVSGDNTLHHAWQAPTPSGWSGFLSLGGSFPSSSEIAVGANKNKRLEVFILGDHNELRHTTQAATATGWTAITSLGGSFAGGISVGTNADGRLEVFGVADSGQVVHLWQTTPSGSWSGVAPIGTTAPADAGTAVATNGDSRLEMFVTRSDSAIWHAWQSFAVSGWDLVIPLGGRGVGHPAAGRTGDGRLVVATVDPKNPTHAWVNMQKSAGSDWATWVSVG